MIYQYGTPDGFYGYNIVIKLERELILINHILHSLIWFTCPALWGDGVEYNSLYSGTLKFPYYKGYVAGTCLKISRTYSAVKQLVLLLVCKYGS